MLFASFLASKWRWVAAVLAAIFAVLLLTQAYEYGSTWWARCAAARTVARTEQAQAARAAAEPAHQHRFDSTLYVRIGQHRELARTLAKIKHLDDSLHSRLPATPALPASPPRQ